MSVDNHWDVGRFHEKFGLHNTNQHGARPNDMPSDLLRFRLRFILEEFDELLAACDAELYIDDAGQQHIFVGKPEETRPNIDIVQAADALIDIAYVVFGFAHLLGLPWQELWNCVQQANMNKERAVSADQSKRGSTWDVVKPEGWQPPDIAGVLRRNGWPV